MKTEEEIIELLKEKYLSPEMLAKAKRDISKKNKTPMPSNVDILEVYHKSGGSDERIVSMLRTRPVRSLSGVVNISVLTKPFDCPGKCVFCPLQSNAPKSYLKNEPAVMRAVSNKYDAKKQINTRIESLKATGHPTGKVELRIVGGTWSFYPLDYREEFIKKCFDACNKEDSSSLEEAQKKNETAEHRIVCLSVETRPDFINKKEVLQMRKMGVTMVEVGIQSLFDDILQKSRRGHDVKCSANATKILKDAGMKVCHQVMLNMPGSSPEKDLQTFKMLFEDSSFRPDFLKIYPCVILKEAPLYKMYKQGKYVPYPEEKVIEVIKEVKKNIIPPYVRIQRLFRDIPSNSIAGGSKMSNMREIIAKDALKEGWKCSCIRCREIKGKYTPEENIQIKKMSYQSSGGEDIFFSAEKNDNLYAILRLRITKSPIIKNAAIIREIHTYGQQVLVKGKGNSPQHKGLGKKLISLAEKEAKEKGKSKIAAISGVGVREYWKSLGYLLEDTYMVKKIRDF